MVTPAVTPEEELEQMRQAYLQITHLHDRTFEACLADKLVRGCLRNTALAMRRAKAAQERLDPARFELVP